MAIRSIPSIIQQQAALKALNGPQQNPLDALIQGFSTGQAIQQLPAQQVQQALMAQLQTELLRERLLDARDPNRAIAREFQKQLAVQSLNPVSGISRVLPGDEGLTVATPVALTPEEQVFADTTGAAPFIGRPAGAPITPVLGVTGQPTSFVRDPNVPRALKQKTLEDQIKLAKAKSDAAGRGYKLYVNPEDPTDANYYIPGTEPLGMSAYIKPQAPGAYKFINPSTREVSAVPLPGYIPYTEARYDSRGNLLSDTKSEITQQNKEDAALAKATASETKSWEKITKDADPLMASSRSPFGAAAIANNRANRALVTLQKPIVTKADLDNIGSDIGGIYQGGVPHVRSALDNSFPTFYGTINGLIQRVTGTPQSAAPEGIRQELIKTLTDLNNTSREVINQQIGTIEDVHPELIQKHQAQWDKLKARFVEGVAGGPTATPVQPTSVPTVNSKAEYDALPSGSTYRDSKGNFGTKR